MEKELENNNEVVIVGCVVSEPKFSHSVLGEDFYECLIACKRLSGADDILPITVSDRIGMKLEVGKRVEILGQIRSYNKQDEESGRNHLILTIFARNASEVDEQTEDRNDVHLHGFVCKPPVFRVTPFRREISDVLLACNRAYKKSDYIPMIVWGRNARLVSELEVGDEIDVLGRFQSREYVKETPNGQQTKIAYEVSVSSVMVEENVRN